MKTFYQDLRLGILGGGQLGRMLVQESINYNSNTWVLDPDEDAPCKNICHHFVVGSLMDYDAVYHFGKQVDILTIEIEQVNVDALDQLELEGVQVYPQARVIRMIQDKGLQKQFFETHNIPSSSFQLISSKEQLSLASISFPYIQKLRRGGYDGKGVYKLHSEVDFENAFEAPSLIEKWVDLDKEIAIIVARNANGEIKTFPCVEMEFNTEANLIESLIAPAELDSQITHRAQQLATKIVESLELIGIMAVELFLTKEGELLVNELAPRPHNSGHQTIEGNYTSQYGQHLRAIFNLPLGDTHQKAYSVMVNLLGSSDHLGSAKILGLDEVLSLSGVYFHWYGKKYTKPFRKMGHVTVIDTNREKAIEKARFVQKKIRIETEL